MVLVQKWPFSQLPCFKQYSPGKYSLRYSRTKKRLSFHKNKKLKNSKNWHFSKGVNPWFWSKNGHFANLFFLGNIGLENILYNILERKNASLGYKNKMLKKSKNCIFANWWTQAFGPKMAIFPSFLFRK